MKEEKKNDVAVLLKPQRPDLLRVGPIGGFNAFEHGSIHLYLAGGP